MKASRSSLSGEVIKDETAHREELKGDVDGLVRS
jgi:hypothetical protein